MSWRDRLRGHVKFVSPSGLEFTPLWKGNDISGEKRLGRHAYPNIDKEVVQDLGMNSREIPLTVYFDGPDNDKKSRDFENALFEPGVWQVTHPVDGLLHLQLVAYKRPTQPVESGNVTEFETEWLEPADDEELSPVADPAAAVEDAMAGVNEATAQDMAAVTQDAMSKKEAAAQAIRQGVAAVKNTVQSTNTRVTAIQKQINELTMAAYLDIAAITGGVIELIQAPGLMLGSAASKIAMFANLGRRIINDLPGAATYTGNQINAGLSGQLFLNAITAAMGNAIISEPAETRREALTVLSEYQQFATEAQAALESVATLTAGNSIENQFVARAYSGEAIATLNAAVARYLMEAMFDLKIERRIVLDRPRAPMTLAITEYKATAENADYYYELLCRTNDLHGRELLLLPTGREVVIYG